MKLPSTFFTLGLPALVIAVLASFTPAEAQQLPVVDKLVNTLFEHYDARPKKEFVPHSYIVTFDPDQVHQDNYDAALKDFYAHFQKDNEFEIKHKYSYNAPGVIMGAAFEARSTKTGDKRSVGSMLSQTRHLISSLHVFSKAKAVSTVKTIHRDRVVHQFNGPTSTLRQRRLRGQGEVGERKDGYTLYEKRLDRVKGRVAARDEDVVIPKDFSPHVLTGVDIQHAQGNFGNGLSVCLIDSPIDYSNDALNGKDADGVPCFGGDECPIVGGYDEFGKGYDGKIVHPGKPYYEGLNRTDEECVHGSHTAGTIIANSTQFAGAAPQSRMFIHSGFPCGEVPEGTGPSGGFPIASNDAGLINSFLRAATERCQVISGSFGADGGWSDETDPLAAVVNTIAKDTALVVMSAGNSRGAGAFFANAPSGGPNVLSVGSTEVGKLPVQSIVPDQPIAGLDFVPVFDAISWTYEEDIKQVGVFFTKGWVDDPEVKNDACDPLPEGTDLKGKIVFVFRGGCLFADKVDNLKQRGAERVIIVYRDNDGHGYLHFSDIDPDLKSISLTNLDSGLALRKAYIDNPDLTVTVNPDGPHVWKFLDNPNVDLMSDFSTQGPGNDLRFVPYVSAPGTGILSTFPGAWSSGVLSGTSMSTPLVAGMGLLMLSSSQGGDFSYDDIRRRLVHTARNVKPDKGNTGPTPLNVQGSGITNVTAAIELTTHIDVIALDSLGDARQAKDKLNPEIVITNEHKEAQEYTLGHTPAQSVLALQEGGPTQRTDTSQMIWLSKPENTGEVAELTFEPAKFTVAPGASQKVKVTIKPPADNPRMLLYSGWIEVQSCFSHGSARVPYGGTAGDISQIPALQTGLSPYNTNLPALYTADLAEQIQDDKSAWALDDNDPSTVPSIVFVQQTASHQLYIDIVDADIKYTPTVPIVDDADPFQGNLSAYVQRDVANTTGDGNPTYVKVSDVPIVGRLDDSGATNRDSVDVTFLDENGFRAHALSSTLANPSDPNVEVNLTPGAYRVLIRSARWLTAKEDLALEASYDSYLSRVFTFDPNAPPRPAPPASGGPGGSGGSGGNATTNAGSGGGGAGGQGGKRALRDFARKAGRM